ncbi:trimethyllysine dioxygenase, mitochondrial isoform X2 [Planococcus citri]
MKNDGNDISITWVDDHESKYNIDWIKIQHQPESKLDQVFWSGQEIENEIPIVSNQESPEQVARVLTTSLLRYGIGLVKHVPPTLEATAEAVNKLGPVMHTLYGGMWCVQTDREFEKYQDTAYTAQELSVHTDNTYFIEPAGLQIFHCIEAAQQGGDTLLVDGFKAARTLKEKYPMSYECLKQTPIEWQYISDQNHYTCTKPIINCSAQSKEIEQIRYNIYDRSPRLYPFRNERNILYQSVKRFRDIVNEKNYQWKLQLTPGTVIFINNWRVLHGRTAFTGNRVLVGCYMGMNALLSKARILKLIV